MGFSIKAKKI